jgi:hypothetical protein
MYYWLVSHLLDYHISKSLYFLYNVTVIHFYAAVHQPLRRLQFMHLPLITSIFNFHLLHYNALVSYWGICLLISTVFFHPVSLSNFLLYIMSLDTLIIFFGGTLFPSQLSLSISWYPFGNTIRVLCFLSTCFIYGNMPLFPLFRASMMSHPCVPRSPFNSFESYCSLSFVSMSFFIQCCWVLSSSHPLRLLICH